MKKVKLDHWEEQCTNKDVKADVRVKFIQLFLSLGKERDDCGTDETSSQVGGESKGASGLAGRASGTELARAESEWTTTYVAGAVPVVVGLVVAGVVPGGGLLGVVPGGGVDGVVPGGGVAPVGPGPWEMGLPTQLASPNIDTSNHKTSARDVIALTSGVNGEGGGLCNVTGVITEGQADRGA